jgi:putative chitinase
MTVIITAYQLATAVQCPMDVAAKWSGPLGAACTEWEINTANRLAAFIAQCAHESLRFTCTHELDSGAAYDTGRLAKRLGNTLQRDGDGQRYKGRGPIQITGHDNVLACSQALFHDDRLLQFPELLEDPAIGARSAGWFWKTNGLNELADFPSQTNFERITKRINGGYNGMSNRLQLWASCKKVF